MERLMSDNVVAPHKPIAPKPDESPQIADSAHELRTSFYFKDNDYEKSASPLEKKSDSLPPPDFRKPLRDQTLQRVDQLLPSSVAQLPSSVALPSSVGQLPYLPIPYQPLQHQSQTPPIPAFYSSSFSFQASPQFHDEFAQTSSFKIAKPRKHHNQYVDVTKIKAKASSSSERPYNCQHPGCEWAFARQSDLRRHSKSHAEPIFHCPYWKNDPTCHKNRGAFNRLDVLKRHLKLVHYIQDKQNVLKSNKEDSGWCRSCQKMFSNSKTFVAHCMDCAQSMPPSKWLSHANAPISTDKPRDAVLSENTNNLLTLSAVVDEFENSEKRMDDRKI